MTLSGFLQVTALQLQLIQVSTPKVPGTEMGLLDANNAKIDNFLQLCLRK